MWINKNNHKNISLSTKMEARRRWGTGRWRSLKLSRTVLETASLVGCSTTRVRGGTPSIGGVGGQMPLAREGNTHFLGTCRADSLQLLRTLTPQGRFPATVKHLFFIVAHLP